VVSRTWDENVRKTKLQINLQKPRYRSRKSWENQGTDQFDLYLGFPIVFGQTFAELSPVPRQILASTLVRPLPDRRQTLARTFARPSPNPCQTLARPSPDLCQIRETGASE